MKMPFQYKQRLFIFDQREIAALSLLYLFICLFAFTLGIHLAKRITTITPHFPGSNTSSVETSPDQVPNQLELAEQSKKTNEAVEETLQQSLHDEIARTGIKLDKPHQVELPKKPKNNEAGATSLQENHKSNDSEIRKTEEQNEPQASPSAKFTLQLGSYLTMDEAKNQTSKLSEMKLNPTIYTTHVHGKGKRFRVYLGNFTSRQLAEKAAKIYQDEEKIETFTITPLNQ